MTDAEHKRMEDAGHPENGWREASPWYEWGPYLAERAWGGVREDYSAGGDAWDSFPHDHARSRAYRWNEDGMAGMTDVFNRLSLALALWNGKDPIIKERMFGLSGPEGNHGEDVKDYWWYLDAIPSSAWLRWRYHYPQAAFPYEDLVTTNRGRSKFEPEYELLDTGVFDDDRYWIVEVHYAKASPTDILMRVTARNRGPETATLHVMPTLWFRNEWAWNPDQVKPELRAGPDGRSILVTHPELGDYTLEIGPGPDGTMPTLLFCENETNRERIEGVPVDDALPEGRHQRPRHRRRRDGQPGRGRDEGVAAGTGWTSRPGRRPRSGCGCTRRPRPPSRGHRGAGGRCGARSWCRPSATAATGEGNGKATAEEVAPSDPLGPSFESTMRRREAEADDFYEALRREGMGDDEHRVMRQAFAGMLWSKQYYGYNVARWLDGDPGLPPPPPERLTAPQRDVAALRGGRHHLDARSVGVPVVRRLGPRVPRGDLRPHRPGVREVPAPAAVPRVVPAPAWGAARRTSGRSTTSTRRSMPRPRYLVFDDRRAQGLRVPAPDLPQAAAQLHVVAQPPGQGGQRPLLGRVPRPRQHRRLRPVAPAGRDGARAVRRDRLDVHVLPQHAPHRDRAVRDTIPRTRTSRRRSWSTPCGSPRR